MGTCATCIDMANEIPYQGIIIAERLNFATWVVIGIFYITTKNIWIYLQTTHNSNLRSMSAFNDNAHRLFRVPYRTVLLANRIFFGETNFFLAYRYSMVRYGTLKVRFVKKSMRVLYLHTYWLTDVILILVLYHISHGNMKRSIQTRSGVYERSEHFVAYIVHVEQFQIFKCNVFFICWIEFAQCKQIGMHVVIVVDEIYSCALKYTYLILREPIFSPRVFGNQHCYIW